MALKTRLKDELYKQLLGQLQELDKEKTKRFSFSTLHDFLSRKAGERFDDHLLTDLFLKLNKGQGGEVTTVEFARAYSEAGLMLTEEIDSLEKEVEEYRVQIRKVHTAFDRTKEEALTAEGIMKDSKLSVEVVEAQNISTGKGWGWVAVSCGGATANTTEVALGAYMRWEQTLAFLVQSGGQEAQVRTMVKEAEGSREVGCYVVALETLRDQKDHEEIVDMGAGKLRVRFRWVWSEKKRLAEVATELEVGQEMAQQSLQRICTSFDHLSAPLRSQSLTATVLRSYLTQRLSPVQTQPSPNAITALTWLLVLWTTLGACWGTDLPNVTLASVCLACLWLHKREWKLVGVLLFLSVYDCVGLLFDRGSYLTAGSVLLKIALGGSYAFLTSRNSGP